MLDPEAQMLLEQLKDIRVPTDPHWWPLAPGWWFVIGLIITLILGFIIRHLIRRHRWKYARLAMTEIDLIEQSNDQDWLIQTHQILCRASLCYFPRHDVANMSEARWSSLLSRSGQVSSSQQIWSEPALELLRDATYKNPQSLSTNDRELLFKQAKLWLEQLPKSSKRINRLNRNEAKAGVNHV